MSYGVLLVYKKKAIGAYLLEKPSGVVTGLKDAQTAMAMQEATEVSGEDFSGDWGERHDEELGASGQAMETSGEDFSGDWGERRPEPADLRRTRDASAGSGPLYGPSAGRRGVPCRVSGKVNKSLSQKQKIVQ